MKNTKKVVKFSKDYSDILKIKNSFYDENFLHLNNRKKIYQEYVNQPKRKSCKNCNNDASKSFIEIHKVKYFFCEKCGHVNGVNEDTKDFTDKLYFGKKGKNYSKVYLNDYVSRVKKIYSPKVDFLMQVVNKQPKVLDVGCGAGHFVYACEINKIEAKGIEPSEELVNLGKNFIKKNNISKILMEDAYSEITNTDSNVISLIGVLEHVRYPRKILESYLKSKAEYLYILVPIFSLSNFIEKNFLNIFPRHSSGGHTHFYTEESLNYIAKEFNLKIVGEWWFGQDFADLYRSLLINHKNLNPTYTKMLNKYLFNEIADLQNVLDKKKICSEVHMIFSKK